jgi:hypothetical protein
MFKDLFENLHFAYIFIAALLFFMGIYLAPIIVERKINWLLIYPRWVTKIIEKYFSPRWGLIPLFGIILLLNNLSLFSGFISGFSIILPFLFAFLTGLNVAIVGYDILGWQGIWHLLVNPVAWLEFPAAWISFGMGVKISAEIVNTKSLLRAYQLFEELVPLYFKYVFVLLVIAAILESGLIIWAEKHKDDPE